jgi:hypothetical protein
MSTLLPIVTQISSLIFGLMRRSEDRNKEKEKQKKKEAKERSKREKKRTSGFLIGVSGGSGDAIG